MSLERGEGMEIEMLEQEVFDMEEILQTKQPEQPPPPPRRGAGWKYLTMKSWTMTILDPGRVSRFG